MLGNYFQWTNVFSFVLGVVLTFCLVVVYQALKGYKEKKEKQIIKDLNR